ncbi:hypothetical protein JZ751_021738 [Albula glossodonta]|uniref:Uncharacterized protein n=1 Tax=Albula glossodonta TaxID=121402 RepID=A0A8T2NMM0_9TELE|nr:hypothetical protein JZ751_021738 [Albula glossodonta]
MGDDCRTQTAAVDDHRPLVCALASTPAPDRQSLTFTRPPPTIAQQLRDKTPVQLCARLHICSHTCSHVTVLLSSNLSDGRVRVPEFHMGGDTMMKSHQQLESECSATIFFLTASVFGPEHLASGAKRFHLLRCYGNRRRGLGGETHVDSHGVVRKLGVGGHAMQEGGPGKNGLALSECGGWGGGRVLKQERCELLGVFTSHFFLEGSKFILLSVRDSSLSLDYSLNSISPSSDNPHHPFLKPSPSSVPFSPLSDTDFSIYPLLRINGYYSRELQDRMVDGLLLWAQLLASEHYVMIGVRKREREREGDILMRQER